MKKMQTCGMMIGALLTLLVTASVQATVITPVSVTASSYYNNPPNVRSPDHTIDGSGLSGSGPWQQHTTDTVTSQTMWLASLGLDPSPTITWDLGAIYGLDGFHFWNYNEPGGERGVSSATVLVSSDNFVTTNYVGTMTFTQATGLNSYTGENYSLVTQGQYVRFTNIAATFAGNDGYAGLAEIRFFNIPEPSVVLLFGMGGWLAWRRRKNG